MELAYRFGDEVWEVLLELSPWLLVGMVVAGLLHGLLPKDFIRRQLQGPMGVLKSVILGIPLPLCSCGVIPAGLGLKEDGASDGSSLAFLIATPQTGVDSVLVSAGMLGWPFALFKVFTAAITGIVGGLLADQVGGAPEKISHHAHDHGNHHGHDQSHSHDSDSSRSIGGMVSHAVDVLRSIWRWLVFGALISALITVALPEGSLSMLEGGGGILAALSMLLISAPLYVCATASVPIAASLVAGGMPTGAALVFLMAGPATNVATIGAIYRGFGTRILGVYLGTIIIGSIGFAMTFDWILDAGVVQGVEAHEHGAAWWAVGSTVVLLGLMAWFALQELRSFFRKVTQAPADGTQRVYEVSGMSCTSCVNKLDGALRKIDGVNFVEVKLDPQQVIVGGAVSPDAVKTIVRNAGFETP